MTQKFEQKYFGTVDDSRMNTSMREFTNDQVKSKVKEAIQREIATKSILKSIESRKKGLRIKWEYLLTTKLISKPCYI